MRVTITDYTHYASDTCCNGGNYSFSVLYRQIAADKFEVLHSTSSDLPYCQLCGSFYQCSCPCGMEGPDIVDSETVDKEITCAIERIAQGEELEIIVKGIIVEDWHNSPAPPTQTVRQVADKTVGKW